MKCVKTFFSQNTHKKPQKNTKFICPILDISVIDRTTLSPIDNMLK